MSKRGRTTLQRLGLSHASQGKPSMSLYDKPFDLKAHEGKAEPHFLLKQQERKLQDYRRSERIKEGEYLGEVPPNRLEPKLFKSGIENPSPSPEELRRDPSRFTEAEVFPYWLPGLQPYQKRAKRWLTQAKKNPEGLHVRNSSFSTMVSRYNYTKNKEYRPRFRFGHWQMNLPYMKLAPAARGLRQDPSDPWRKVKPTEKEEDGADKYLPPIDPKFYKPPRDPATHDVPYFFALDYDVTSNTPPPTLDQVKRMVKFREEKLEAYWESSLYADHQTHWADEYAQGALRAEKVDELSDEEELEAIEALTASETETERKQVTGQVEEARTEVAK